MSWYLADLLKPSVFDPKGKLIASKNEILQRLWDRRRENNKDEPNNVPSQLAILSFAGLDTNDTLLYPLLAHELGHFIDFSFDPPLNLRKDLRTKCEITRDQIKDVIEKSTGQSPQPLFVSAVQQRLVQQVYVAIREVLADLLAVRMLGFAFFVAQAEFLKTLAPWPQTTITSSGYPGMRFRLRVIYDHLIGTGHDSDSLKFLEKRKQTHGEIAQRLISFLSTWKKRLEPDLPSALPQSQPSDTALAVLVENAVKAVIDDLQEIARQIIPEEKCAKLSDLFFIRIQRLQQELPPVCSKDSTDCFAELLSAGWAYQILFGEDQERSKVTLDDQRAEYDKTCRLILKAIELTPMNSDRDPFLELTPYARVDGEQLETKGVLGASEIAGRLKLPINDPRHLDVVPLDPSALNAASLDVHLGHWFVVARRSRLRGVKIGDLLDERLLRAVGREEVFVPLDGTFLVHPGDLVLGATLEFLSLPADLMAFVEGRSGIGRMGLIVATATQVAPGFHGVVVLEMANAGTVPIEVSPRIPIAQLVLQVMANPVPAEKLYRGKYHCQVQP
jgi:dCTP deaminase